MGRGQETSQNVGRLVAPSGISIIGTLDVEEEEWTRYVVSLELVRLPDDAAVLPVLGEVLAAAPIPAPWLLCRGPDGELFFANETTHASSFTHPFHVSLQKLARVCPTLLNLPRLARRSLIVALRDTWDKEAKQEFGMWYSAKADTGQEYFYHADTMAVMWENPRDVILPAHDLKLQALEYLEDDAYILRILSDPRSDIRTSAAEARRCASEPTASAAHAEAVANLLVDECEWIRAAAAEALLDLGGGGEASGSKSAQSTTTSWFSAASRTTVMSAP